MRATPGVSRLVATSGMAEATVVRTPVSVGDGVTSSELVLEVTDVRRGFGVFLTTWRVKQGAQVPAYQLQRRFHLERAENSIRLGENIDGNAHGISAFSARRGLQLNSSKMIHNGSQLAGS